MRRRVLRATVAMIALSLMLSQATAWGAGTSTRHRVATPRAVGDPDGGSDVRAQSRFTLRVPIIRYGDPDMGGGSRLPQYYRLLSNEFIHLSRWLGRPPASR